MYPTPKNCTRPPEEKHSRQRKPEPNVAVVPEELLSPPTALPAPLPEAVATGFNLAALMRLAAVDEAAANHARITTESPEGNAKLPQAPLEMAVQILLPPESQLGGSVMTRHCDQCGRWGESRSTHLCGSNWFKDLGQLLQALSRRAGLWQKTEGRPQLPTNFSLEIVLPAAGPPGRLISGRYCDVCRRFGGLRSTHICGVNWHVRLGKLLTSLTSGGAR